MDFRADIQGSRLLVMGSTREIGLGKEMTLPVREVEKGSFAPHCWESELVQLLWERVCSFL